VRTASADISAKIVLPTPSSRRAALLCSSLTHSNLTGPRSATMADMTRNRGECSREPIAFGHLVRTAEKDRRKDR
jgi:hypothetical protein